MQVAMLELRRIRISGPRFVRYQGSFLMDPGSMRNPFSTVLIVQRFAGQAAIGGWADRGWKPLLRLGAG